MFDFRTYYLQHKTKLDFKSQAVLMYILYLAGAYTILLTRTDDFLRVFLSQLALPLRQQASAAASRSVLVPDILEVYCMVLLCVCSWLCSASEHIIASFCQNRVFSEKNIMHITWSCLPALASINCIFPQLPVPSGCGQLGPFVVYPNGTSTIQALTLCGRFMASSTQVRQAF